MLRFLRFFIAVGGISLSLCYASPREEPLRYPKQLKSMVDFWIAIYTKYSTRQGIVHDSEDLSIVYEAIELPKSGDETGLYVLKDRIKETLLSIVRKQGKNLNPFERKILSKFPREASRLRVLKASENVRFQLGQSDRFKEGVRRSGRYMDHIERVLRHRNLPDYLKYLPHVESSFQEYAMSKFGAAGLWQLMPETGKQYLTVNYAIDERLDPWISSSAAIKHLQKNYEQLGSWPLALTAYNHGVGGVKRAVKYLDSSRIEDLALRYSSKRFGFASRNFFAQFLAAVEVSKNYRKYFGPVDIASTATFDKFILKHPTYLKTLKGQYKFTDEEFKRLNPGLRKPVLKNQRPIPRWTTVRVPKNSRRKEVLVASLDTGVVPTQKQEKLPEIQAAKEAVEAEVPKLELDNKKYQVHDYKNEKGWVEVSMNETINLIAEWAGVSTKEIRTWNSMTSTESARLGQKLLVKLDKTKLIEFQQERADYHKSVREDFFEGYMVSEVSEYKVRRGDNLWSICYQKFEVPPWLLAEYNPRMNLSSLSPGSRLKIPVIRPRESELASALQ